jgi:hypothetical protein
VAADTQDIIQNNISFSKVAIPDAFTGVTPSLYVYLLVPSLQLKNLI